MENIIFVENQFVELKSKLTSNIKKEIIAFANTNGGTIYIGITDDGIPIGLQNAAKDLEALSGMIREGINPDLTLSTKIYIELIEEKEIIVINVSEGINKPYYLSDKGMKATGVYIRHGVSSTPTTDENIRKMIAENIDPSFEKSLSQNQELNLDYFYHSFKEKNIDINKSKEKTLNLINHDNLYTNLALLLSEECPFTIKCALYNGTDKTEFKDRKEFNGSLLKQMNDVFEYLEIFNRISGKIIGINRIDIKDYPDYALRETILNAIIHRDYNFKGSILIHLFDDRIEILSLGGLVKGLSLNDILMGVSEPRNPNLANIFYRLKHVESFGTGINRIISSYEEFKLLPQLKNSENGFLVVLPNVNYKATKESDATFNTQTQEELIINYINKYGSITRSISESILKVERTRASIILNKMVANKILKKDGIGKSTKYVLK